MSLPRSRNNLITVRLLEEEHQRLKNACESGGARSISDFVREIIVQRVTSSRSPGTAHLAGDLETIAVKLEELDTALKDLSERILDVLGRSERKEEPKWKAS
jgi:hypothetical protein